MAEGEPLPPLERAGLGCGPCWCRGQGTGPGDTRTQSGPLQRTWGRWSLWMLCPQHMEKPVLLLRGQNQARPGVLRGWRTQRELLLAGAGQAREGETPPPLGVIKPGRGLLELFQGQGASPWPPNPPPFLRHPRAGGRGSWRHQSPGLPVHFFPRRRDSAQSPRRPLLARPAAQQWGLCDPLTTAVPWRQRSADRRPPCQQHDRCRPALPGSVPGARHPGLARPATRLWAGVCPPQAWRSAARSRLHLGGLPHLALPDSSGRAHTCLPGLGKAVSPQPTAPGQGTPEAPG